MLIQRSADAFHTELLQLAQLTQDLVVRREERRKATKARFNVFRVLYPPHYEVQLHSRFITYLLDANAEHDCGRLFLDLFIDTLEQEAVLNHNDKTAPAGSFDRLKQIPFVSAVPEGDGGYGRRIDILLTFHEQFLAIENKIWAREQEGQIKDYSDHLKSRGGNSPLLLYLTLWGDASATSADELYFRISYEKHILRWMENCLQATYQFVGINQSLQQYRDVIIGLLGKGIANEKDEMKTTTDFIRNHPSILRNGFSITASLEEARKQGIRDFFHDLGKALEDHPTVFSVELAGADIAEGNSGHILLKGVVDVLEASSLSVWIERGGVGRGQLYLGIVPVNAISESERVKLSSLQVEFNRRGFAFVGSNENWPIGWHFLYEDFFSFEHAAEMLDIPRRDEAISRIVEAILRFFEVLPESWRKIISCQPKTDL